MPKIPEGDCHLCAWRGHDRVAHLRDDHGVDAVDLDQAALLLGRDRRMVMNYGADGKITRVARGLYDRASVLAYRATLHELADRGVISRPNATAERATDAHQIAATIAVPSGDPDWWDRAACAGKVDPEFFFPDKRRANEHAPRIRTMCEPCPVRGDCLAHALIHEVGHHTGWWGGLSQAQRRELRATVRRRSRKAVA